MPFILYRSSDGRITSSMYSKRGNMGFCLAENIKNGVLITEFDMERQVTNQTYSRSGDALNAMKEYLKLGEPEIRDSGTYVRVEAQFSCSGCNGVGMVRELDLSAPSVIDNVPVVPIFVCRKCGKRHYSLTDEYLKALVESNKEMFEGEDLREIDRDIDSSIATMQEYIIRIFASKKINRMKK